MTTEDYCPLFTITFEEPRNLRNMQEMLLRLETVLKGSLPTRDEIYAGKEYLHHL